MADLTWHLRPPLEAHLLPPAASTAVDIEITPPGAFRLVQVMVRREQWDPVAKAVQQHLGAAPPNAPRIIATGPAELIWTGPGSFMAMAPEAEGLMLEGLRGALAGLASISEQSHGACHIRLSGPGIADLMARLVSLDLHDSAFPPGTAARTTMDHVPVILWRPANRADGTPCFAILVPTSYAESLLAAIANQAKGIEMPPTRPRVLNPNLDG